MTTPLRWLTLALFAGTTLGLTNCKKDKEPDPDKRSQREIWLTTPGWKLQRFVQAETSPAGAVTTYEFPLNYFGCQQDDLNHYNANRTFRVDDGPMQCQPPASGTTWDFAANETEIVFGSFTRHTKIVTLTATTLELASPDTLINGTRYMVTQTYAAQ